MTCEFCRGPDWPQKSCPIAAAFKAKGDWQVEHLLDYMGSDEWRATHGANKQSFESALVFALHYRVGCGKHWAREPGPQNVTMRIHNLITGEIVPIDEALETIIE